MGRPSASAAGRGAGGRVKGGPARGPWCGGGGYSSGQGATMGPTLCDPTGAVKIDYGWPSLPGAHLEHWNERAPREPNYYPVNHIDGWWAWEPRTVNGVLQGRWASDRIMGGGLWLPEGICYWPTMGTGDLDCHRQTTTFGLDVLNQCWRYTYDPLTFSLTGYSRMPEDYPVGGQEIGPDGKVYLCRLNVWGTPDKV